MSFASLSLGERIVLVARMAAEAHLGNVREKESQVGRRVAGGAGWDPVTDELAPSNSRRAGNSAPIAEGDGQ